MWISLAIRAAGYTLKPTPQQGHFLPGRTRRALPRPTGKSTQVIITTYDLPDEATPHDTLLDKDGNVWFTDFQHQFISKLDPKTGKVTRYPVPVSKPGFPTGGLMVTMDKDGHIWEAMMGQAQIAELDPKTEKVSIYLAPDWDKGDKRFTMIDALHSKGISVERRSDADPMALLGITWAALAAPPIAVAAE